MRSIGASSIIGAAVSFAPSLLAVETVALALEKSRDLEPATLVAVPGVKRLPFEPPTGFFFGWSGVPADCAFAVSGILEILLFLLLIN